MKADRHHIVSLLLTATLAGTAPLAASAAPCPPPTPVMALPPLDLPGELGALGLSDAQQDKVFKLFDTQAATLRKALRRISDRRQTLAELAHTDHYDAAAAKRAATALGSAIAGMALLQTRQAQQIYQLLTPDQRKQLRRMEHGGRERCAGPAGLMPMAYHHDGNRALPPANSCRDETDRKK